MLAVVHLEQTNRLFLPQRGEAGERNMGAVRNYSIAMFLIHT
jgi:hypothetical protein